MEDYCSKITSRTDYTAGLKDQSVFSFGGEVAELKLGTGGI